MLVAEIEEQTMTTTHEIKPSAAYAAADGLRERATAALNEARAIPLGAAFSRACEATRTAIIAGRTAAEAELFPASLRPLDAAALLDLEAVFRTLRPKTHVSQLVHAHALALNGGHSCLVEALRSVRTDAVLDEAGRAKFRRAVTVELFQRQMFTPWPALSLRMDELDAELDAIVAKHAQHIEDIQAREQAEQAKAAAEVADAEMEIRNRLADKICLFPSGLDFTIGIYGGMSNWPNDVAARALRDPASPAELVAVITKQATDMLARFAALSGTSQE